jgi:hypothetical protein
VEGSKYAVQKKHISWIYAEHARFGKSHVNSGGLRSLHRIQDGIIQMHNKALLKNYTYWTQKKFFLWNQAFSKPCTGFFNMEIKKKTMFPTYFKKSMVIDFILITTTFFL